MYRILVGMHVEISGFGCGHLTVTVNLCCLLVEFESGAVLGL
jgi:hypothetical protein